MIILLQVKSNTVTMVNLQIGPPPQKEEVDRRYIVSFLIGSFLFLGGGMGRSTKEKGERVVFYFILAVKDSLSPLQIQTLF